jgi:predicted amidophosphoribosyltransferase
MKLCKVNWQTLLVEHCYLDMTDECYFTADYHGCYRDSIKPTILSLKRGHGWAIAQLARQLTLVLPHEWTNAYTFVPMPPSSGSTSPLHSVVRQLRLRDTRELITQIYDTPASHNGWRPTPEQRVRLMRLNNLETEPKPQAVVIIDDVLATGSHFRAAKMIVRERWPQMRVIGLFIARVCRERKAFVVPCREETRVG